MSRTNLMKQKLKNGESVFGTWSMLGSASAVNAMGEAGLDFVVLDMEHGPMTVETVQYQMYAAEAAGCTPIVRIGKYDDLAILRVLDAGAQALMVSHIATPEEAAAVVSSALYTPRGDRGLSPFTRGHGYTDEGITEKLNRANEEMFIGVLVEGQEGIDNIEAICDVPGLDMVYLGIYDISQALGVPGQVNHPSVLEVVEKSVKLIRDKGCIAGTVARDTTYLKNMVDWGFQFVSYRVDCAILRDGFVEMRETFDTFRNRGDEP